MIRTSLFLDKDDREPKPYDSPSFSAFVEALAPDGKHIPTDLPKKKLGAFSPVEYIPGKRRGQRNILRVHVAALDIDNITPEQFATLLPCLQGLNSLIYTTYRHPKAFRQADSRYKLRVLVELSEPVSGDPRHWKNFWMRLNQRFAGLTDPSTKDVSRLFYGPFCAEGEEEEHFLFRFEGAPLNVEELKQKPLQIDVRVMASQSFAREMLGQLAKKLLRSTDPYQYWLGQCLNLVDKGEVYAEPGQRDIVTFKLACAIAEAFPHASAADVSKHFAPSIQLMTAIDIDCLTIEDVEEKVQRKQQEVLEEDINRAEEEEEQDRMALLKAFQGKRSTPYTQEELQGFANKQGCTIEDLRSRWVIQHKAAYYVYYNGEYYHHTKDDFASAALVRLAPAQTSGVQLRKMIGKEVVPLGPKELVDHYGTVVDSHVMSYIATNSAYDPQQNRLVESVATLRRDLRPTFDPVVDQWLRLLGGEHYAALQEWLAGTPLLYRASSALILIGKTGAGKGLLAAGLARLWSSLSPPTRLAEVLGTPFNAQLTTMPLVLADEALPSDFKGNGKTAELREFIQAAAHSLNQKYKPPSTLVGHIRLIIAANNENIFNIHEHFTPEDIEAIASRFCRVNVSEISKRYLETLGREQTTSMIYDDRIANHVLHLAVTYAPAANDRFIAGGQGVGTYEQLATMNPLNSLVFQWLVDALLNPTPVTSNPKAAGHFFVGAGEYLVNAKAIQATWEMYAPPGIDRCPTVRSIGLALSSCSSKRTQKIHPDFPNGAKVNFHKIRLDTLATWCHTHNYASREELKKALQKGKLAIVQ